MFSSQQTCPSFEEITQAMRKCGELGMKGVLENSRGCKMARCVEEKEDQCRDLPEREFREKEIACKEEGKKVFVNYDSHGCKKISCGDENACPKEIAKEAYFACNGKGGELIVKRDFNGCVSFSECVRRGDSSESAVEEIGRIPESGEMLSIAFKLEELKLEFDKLARKSEDIANYYKSTGSSDEERFRRVASMFNAAKGKVDELRAKIRENIDDMSAEEVSEVKRDLRYLKNVVLKDILYVMLSNGEEVEKIKSDTQEDCDENDGECFNDAIRICKPITFSPEGDEGPLVEITGLVDGKCEMKVTMDESNIPKIPGFTPPYQMNCKIEKYSLGVNDPDKDIIPYCTGNLVDLMKLSGGKGGRGGPSVPGVCSGEECKTYCSKGPEEARKCLEYLGKFMPPEVLAQMEALANGGSSPAGTGDFPGGFGEGEPIPERDIQSTTYPVRTLQQYPQPQQYSKDQFPQQGEQCRGCFDNGVCDPGECSTCNDCR